MYNDFMDELEYAAECGFDAVCVNEHHSNGYGLMPSPNLIASSLARRTTDTAICVMGNSLALYNPPTRVAEEFAMIDVHLRRPADRRLPGRLADGHLLRLRPEPVDAARALLRGARPGHARRGPSSDTFAFNGRFNQQRYVNIWPRPVQKPHPPIWIPGGGSVETWQWCAEMDYVYCYLSYYGYKAGQATMDGFWDEMDRLGKDRNPYRAGFLQFVGVAESREQALRALQRAGRVFLRPLPACRSALRRPARLHHRGDPARRHREPGAASGSGAAPPGSETSSRRWRARWMRSSTTATSSSARPTRWPSS